MNNKVKFVVSFELAYSKNLRPALSSAFEATLERFLLPYKCHFEHRNQRAKSPSHFLHYIVDVEVRKAEAVFYLGKLIEAEAGILQLFDESVLSFSFSVES